MANRLLHANKHSGSDNNYDYNNINNRQFPNGTNQLKTESEALFNEIDSTQFDSFNSLDNNDNPTHHNAQYYPNLEHNDSPNTDSWKMSASTAEVRNTFLRKLATAIETNQNIALGEASLLAREIETKAFGVANSEAEYKARINKIGTQVCTFIPD